MLFALTALMRTAHVVAAGVWVGGSVVYLYVITPALRASGAGPQTGAAVSTLFRRLVGVCIGVVLVSGVYLVFDRLSTLSLGPVYVIVLGVKFALALAMILLAVYQAQEARRIARLRGHLWKVAPLWMLALGLGTFVLGAVLTGMFEAMLAH